MKPLRALIVEDSEADASLLLRELRKEGYSPVHQRVETAEEMANALSNQEWDVVLSDYILPGFSGLAVIRMVRGRGLDLPIIIVSGQIGEDTAVETMRAGANDYIMKDNLKRLVPAIERELTEALNRRQRREMEATLRAKEEELRISRQVDIIKDEFIGMVSHELKTPLTVIIGALRVATSEGISEEEAKDIINDAVTEVEALAAMVDNLLELSRHQANRLSLQTEQTQVEPVVRTVVQKLQTRSALHRLTIDVPAGLPAVMMDAIRIERVLYNLVENAIKYSPKGGDVRIFGRQDGNRLVMGVNDTGIGISPQDQARLFQKFQRLEVDGKYGIAGLGLGLRVCRILVEAHGGEIWVESSPGQGATFYFKLPL